MEKYRIRGMKTVRPKEKGFLFYNKTLASHLKRTCLNIAM
jgi:hypothetical protein